MGTKHHPGMPRLRWDQKEKSLKATFVRVEAREGSIQQGSDRPEIFELPKIRRSECHQDPDPPCEALVFLFHQMEKLIPLFSPSSI